MMFDDLDDFLNKKTSGDDLDKFLANSATTEELRQETPDEETRRRMAAVESGRLPHLPTPADSLWKGVKTISSGVESSFANAAQALDFYSTKLSELTGLPKGGLFGKLAQDWGYWGDRLKTEGYQGVAGELMRGAGRGVGDMAQIGVMGGGPVGMAAHGGIMGGQEGLGGALTGAAGGALAAGALGGIGKLPQVAQVPAAAAMGAVTTPGGLEERVGGGAEMALLQLAGAARKPVSPELEALGTLEKQIWQGGGYSPTQEQPEVVKRLISAVKSARTIRGKQNKLYAKERATRFAQAIEAGEKVPGEAGYYEQLSKLKGELPKAAFEPVRDQFTQGDVDSLFNMIQTSPRISETDKWSAKGGLAQLLGTDAGGVPQPKQLRMLNDVFGKELTDTLITKKPLWSKIAGVAGNSLNIMRSVMASGDLSFGFRQGILAGARHPLMFAKNFVKQFPMFASEKSYRAVEDSIVARPNYDLYKQSGLAITDIGKTLSSREEAFQSSYAEKIPLVGKIVRASGRAYTGMANLLRADTFDYMVKRAQDMGQDPYSNANLSAEIANFVNAATGRGGLGPLERSAVALNTVMFSPRLIASRVKFLNPATYITGEKLVRQEALKTLLAFTGYGMTLLGAAKMAGARVGDDPRSADFGKIIVGKTRFDMLGGFGQYARFAAQMITGKLVSSTTGKVSTIGEGYRPINRLEIAERFIQSKEAPVFSLATALLKGEGTFGKELNVPKELAERFIPMVVQDAYDIWKTDPSIFPASALGVFGAGLQTYTDIKPSDSLLNTKSMTRFYEAKNNLEIQNRRVNDAIKSGDIDKAKQIQAENPLLRLVPVMGQIEKQIAAYRKAIDQIAANESIDKAEKNRRMKELADKIIASVEARKDLWGQVTE